MYAILTGDVVGSQEMGRGEQARLHEILAKVAGYAQLDRHFEVFRGDSWQASCHPVETAVARALAFRSYLLGKYDIKTRIAIGLGTVDTFRADKISLSQGEAFVLSGKSLNSMPDDRHLTIATSESLTPATRSLLDAACALLDGITSEWTQKQALAVALASSGAPQNELAPQFDPPISAQAFGKHLASAQWKLIKTALESIAKALQHSLPSQS